MKKHIYRLMASLLIVTTMMSVTACSNQEIKSEVNTTNQDSKDTPMGRYIEENIELPKDLKSLVHYQVLEDERIQVYGYTANNKGVTYTSKDGKEWVKEEAKWFEKLVEENNMGIQIAHDGKSTIYVSYFDDDYKIHIAKVVNNEALEEVPYDTNDLAYSVTGIKALPDGNIAVGLQYNGVVVLDSTTGAVIKEYLSTGMDREFGFNQDEVMLLDTLRGGLVTFDLETAQEKTFIPCEGSLWGSKLEVSTDGNAYLINEEGVSRLAKGGSVWEQIIEGQLSSFGMPSLYIENGMVKGDEEFLVLFYDRDMGYQLSHYRFDPNTPTKPTTEVNLYMLEDNVTMRQAIATYQRQNPGVFINIQVGVEEGGSMTKADAIRTLNTQLLAGKGPDLLLLDGLPVQSYIEKGVLLDMSNWAKEKIEQGEWLPNIVGAFQEENSIYTLPLRFSLPTMWGNKAIIENIKGIEDLASWAKSNPDKEVFYKMSPEKLMNLLYGPTAHTWIDEKGQIKEAEFITFLEAIKELTQVDNMGEQDEIAWNFLSTEYMASKDTQLHLENISGFDGLNYQYSGITQRGDGDFDLIFAGEESTFEPRGIIGINANSKYQDIAREIVQLAMSKEVQSVNLGDGLPVHKQTFEEQAVLNPEQNFMSFPVSFEKPIAMIEVTQEVYSKVKELAEKATIPVVKDEVLLNLIIEETKGYFNGEKTAEEAASAVAKRTRAYLAE